MIFEVVTSQKCLEYMDFDVLMINNLLYIFHELYSAYHDEYGYIDAYFCVRML